MKADEYSIGDRLAIALLNAVVGFITALFLWIAVVSFVSQLYEYISFQWVLYFTAACAALGFLLCENFLLNSYAKIWRFIVYWF